MLRQLTALVVIGALVFGSVGASASSTTAPSTAAPPTAVAKNKPPLKPAGPAGIRQAQGSTIENLDTWVIGGLALVAIVWVLVD